MSATETADLLERTAAAIRAGEVTDPIVSLQYIVTGEDDQDAALIGTAALYPGLTWEGHVTENELLGPAAHIHGRDGRVLVTVSARADRLHMATVAGLTAEKVPA
jgi:hypothetical protein